MKKEYVAAGTPITPSVQNTPISQPTPFEKAEHAPSFLRMGISGPSGSGKTHGALEIARGLVGPSGSIGLIDTDRGRSRTLATLFDFDIAVPVDSSFESIAATLAAAASYDVIIIDTISAPWRALLDELDVIARQKFGGDSRSAWREGGPRVKAFFDSIHKHPAHVICTMRSETDWITVTGSAASPLIPNVARVGIRPDQTKGVEYEFDVFAMTQPDRSLRVIKDLTGCLQDRYFDRVGPDLGRILNECGYFTRLPAPANPQTSS
jgi:hypothetical protein